jgi:hypothetical protein
MTITIRIPDSQEADLRAQLEAKGITLSEFVREAIAEKLRREEGAPPSPAERGRHLFGRYGSGRDDLSVNHEAILGEMLDAKYRR